MIKLPGVTHTSRETERRLSFDLAAGLIVLLGLAFRLYHIDFPMVDGHSWRQITNADIARHYTEGSLNLFVPRVSWGGLNGVVGMEFPLLQYVTGLLWRLTTEQHLVARLVAVAFSVAGILAIYFLGTRLFGRPAGRAAAFLLAVSPSAVYFGRSFLSDTPMMTFMIVAVLAWDRYFDRPSVSRAALAALPTMLCALVKLPAILVFAPIVGLAWARGGWPRVFDRRLIAGCVASLAAVAAWYWYADRIYLETGLTQAVFRPSGTYPQDQAPGVVYTSVSHFATAERLADLSFWWDMLVRFWRMHLTPLGFAAVAVAPLVLWRHRAGAAVGLWVLGGVTLLIVSAEGQWQHEFHQLPFLPPLMLAFGAVAAPAFDGARLGRVLRPPLAVILTAVTLTAVAFVSFTTSPVQHDLYRTSREYAPATHFIHFGNVIQGLVPPDALVVTVDYERGGANSPMLLFFSRRQGWSFDLSTISPGVIENLRVRYGAQFFATAIGRDIRRERIAVLDYLEQFEAVPTPPQADQLLLVDLRRPKAR